MQSTALHLEHMPLTTFFLLSCGGEMTQELCREGHCEGCGKAAGEVADLHASQVGDGVEVDALEVALVGHRRELPPPVQRQ